MPRLTADLVQQAPSFINPVRDRQLDLRGKMIPAIENLGATQDQYDTIDFSDNEIEKLENFPILPRLQSMYFNNNHISKISAGISDCLPKLNTLILTNNRLVNLHDIDPLAEISSLHTLSLIDNVITKKPHYRLYVIHKLPLLRLLDFKKIKAKERAEAVKMFGPVNLPKRKKGKLLRQIEQQQKTFTPGVAEKEASAKVVTETPADQLAIKIAIENAKTMEEVQKLERMIKSGKAHEDTNMADT